MDDVDQMLDVKEEMSKIVEENYKLRAREVEETCKLKVKQMEESYRAKVTELNRKKQKEIEEIRKEMESKMRKELDTASNSRGNNWSPGEKQKVLDDRREQMQQRAAPEQPRRSLLQSTGRPWNKKLTFGAEGLDC